MWRNSGFDFCFFLLDWSNKKCKDPKARKSLTYFRKSQASVAREKRSRKEWCEVRSVSSQKDHGASFPKSFLSQPMKWEWHEYSFPRATDLPTPLTSSPPRYPSITASWSHWLSASIEHPLKISCSFAYIHVSFVSSHWNVSSTRTVDSHKTLSDEWKEYIPLRQCNNITAWHTLLQGLAVSHLSVEEQINSHRRVGKPWAIDNWNYELDIHRLMGFQKLCIWLQ